MTGAKHRHDSLNLVGLRALATAAGLLQLCRELRAAGVLKDEAIERIKQSILDELLMQSARSASRRDQEQSMRARLDDLFSGSAQLSDDGSPLAQMASEEGGEA